MEVEVDVEMELTCGRWQHPRTSSHHHGFKPGQTHQNTLILRLPHVACAQPIVCSMLQATFGRRLPMACSPHSTGSMRGGCSCCTMLLTAGKHWPLIDDRVVGHPSGMAGLKDAGGAVSPQAYTNIC